MTTRILRLKEVMEKTGKSRAGIYNDAAAGIFPKQIKLGRRASGWIEAEINQWLEDRIADRNDAA